MLSSFSEPTWPSLSTKGSRVNVNLVTTTSSVSKKATAAATKGKPDSGSDVVVSEPPTPPPPVFIRRVTAASPPLPAGKILWIKQESNEEEGEEGKLPPNLVVPLQPCVRPFFPIDGVPNGPGVLRRVASFDTFSFDDDDDDYHYNVGMEECWLSTGSDTISHEEVTQDLEMEESKPAYRPKGCKTSMAVLDHSLSMVVEDKEDVDQFLDAIMVDLIGGDSFIPGLDEEERDSLEDMGDSLNGRTATSFKPRTCKDRPARYRSFRLSTPPASPPRRHNDHLDEEPPMVTPDETPMARAVVGEQLDVCVLDSNTADLALLNPSTSKKYNNNNNNKRSLDAAMMEDEEGSGDDDSLSPPALFSERPFPLSMKPTLRILLYLDENWQDRVKVRTAFDIVHQFYKKHKDGDKRYRKVGQLGGAIFAALIAALGEDLGESIRLSHSYESSRLEDLIRAPGGTTSHSRSHKSPRKRAPKKAPISSPTMIELAIAYGANFKRLHPTVHLNSLAEQVRMGALAVESMDEAQQQEAWAKLMKTSLS